MLAIAHVGLGAALIELRAYDEARVVVNASVEGARAVGSRIGTVDALMNVATLAEATRDWSVAEHAMLEAGEIAARIEAGRALQASRIRLALFRAMAGRGREARPEMDQLVEERARAGAPPRELAGALAAVSACAASARDWRRTGAALERIAALPPEPGAEFVAEGLGYAVELARAGGEASAADQAQVLRDRWSRP